MDYDQGQHIVYAQGRDLPPETMASWMRAFTHHAPRHRPLTVLDLGSGTGRFSPALAETFEGQVHGVEPSERMREVAQTSAGHPRVDYLAGSAEHIPLRSGTCDLALMYLVLHHVSDRSAAAGETARVLRSGGRLLIRSAFADRLPDLVWHRCFPRARSVEEALFPPLAEVVETFTTAGLSLVTLDQVHQRVAPSLAAYAARLHLRALSTFMHLTEEEIEAGFVALDTAVKAETDPHPVEEDCDLLVLTK